MPHVSGALASLLNLTIEFTLAIAKACGTKCTQVAAHSHIESRVACLDVQLSPQSTPHLQVLGAAVVTSLVIIAWVSTLSASLFVIIKRLGILRVSAEMEDAGMDVSKHGGPFTSAMDLMQVRSQSS